MRWPKKDALSDEPHLSLLWLLPGLPVERELLWQPGVIAMCLFFGQLSQFLALEKGDVSVAVPIFHDFMAEALAGKPAVPFRIPPGVRLVRVDAETGRPAGPGDRNVILEAFKADMPPGVAAPLVGQSRSSESESSVEAGGLY